MSEPVPNLHKNKTSDLTGWFKKTLKSGINPRSARAIAPNLGCNVSGEIVQFGLWHPELIHAETAEIEFFSPLEPIYYNRPEQHIDFQYWQFPLTIVDQFAFGVFEGLSIGRGDPFGCFYQFRIQDDKGTFKTCYDPLASSLPFGLHAPAEVYDLRKMQTDRKDVEYYKNLDLSNESRIKPSSNILEIHTATATKDGTLQSLTKEYQSVAKKIENGDLLTSFEYNLTGFDAVELMPLEPVAQHPNDQIFWDVVSKINDNSVKTVHVKNPDVINWGYDVVVYGSASVNASLLSTGRPHELRELIETLHNFPGKPIKVILDLVYGHAEDKAAELMPDQFFSNGINRFGLSLNVRDPMVRSILLEMQRRKINWGFDGIRVDASHDITYYDSKSQSFRIDDKFLDQMSETEQKIADVTYKSWMIFEDGRPWPRSDWVLATTYKDLLHRQDEAYQWGPMVFAYNKPYAYTHWLSNWWRIREICRTGNRWITGNANHDTVRRINQEDPSAIHINKLLGNSPKQIVQNAYNNPSVALLFHGFLPGIPMDFLNSLSHSPWCFFRNTDTESALRVIAEETYFQSWQVSEGEFQSTYHFRNLKHLGFDTREELHRFIELLNAYLKFSNQDTGRVIQLLNTTDPVPGITEWNRDKLDQFADAWITDVSAFCNIETHRGSIKEEKAIFNARVRKFRQDNPWLRRNLTGKEMLAYSEPVDGTVVGYGYREHPGTGQPYAIVANLEGSGKKINLKELKLPTSNFTGWIEILSTPGLKTKDPDKPIKLNVSQGVMFTKSIK